MGGREAVQVADPVASVVNLYPARGVRGARAYGGVDPVARLASAVAALLLEAITRDEPAVLIGELADLLGEVSRPAPSQGEPAWPAEPLTESETRVLRYLATHLSAREIAVELCVSANTVKTHVRHLYEKLGAHGRREAVHRARAAGLLAVPLRRPQAPIGVTSWDTGTQNATSS